jgi:hypothetical protein
MAEDSGQTVLPVLKSHILPLVPTNLVDRSRLGVSSACSWLIPAPGPDEKFD